MKLYGNGYSCTQWTSTFLEQVYTLAGSLNVVGGGSARIPAERRREIVIFG